MTGHRRTIEETDWTTRDETGPERYRIPRHTHWQRHAILVVLAHATLPAGRSGTALDL
ncbi:hypothetical protein GCM10025784_17000 [Citricoccus nitrophenolicus]